MKTLRRAPYGRDELRRLYDPASVAVVGASPRPSSFGARTAANLAGFAGRVFLVNERYAEIGEARCFPGLDALPEVPDVAIVTTPAASVEAVIADCIAAGVPSAIVYASGFAETGEAGTMALQGRIVERAAGAGLRLLGPNCVGLLNYNSGARMTFAGVPETRAPSPAAIGLVSQSGALGFALVQALERGVSFSHVLSSGNSGDVDVADWVSALAEDPSCAVIACIFEGVTEPLRLLAAARRAWEHDKPLVVYKLATGETGAAAALSHTGSLAGSDASWRALLESAGAIAVDDYEDLIETAAFFGKAGTPTASGAAVLAGSGGAAILGADCAERRGVPLPQPQPAVTSILRARIPAFGSARNPCDVTAQVISDPSALMDCAGALLSDPSFGALVYGSTYAYAPATERLPRFSELARVHGKPVCVVWLTQWLQGPGSHVVEADPRLIMFRSMDRCFATLAAWTARADRRRAALSRPAGAAVAPPESPARHAEPRHPGTRDRGAWFETRPSGAPRHDDRSGSCFEPGSEVSGLLPEGEAVLGERDVKALLSAYGVRVSRDVLVSDAASAARAAETIGGKLVLKIESPDIPHKTEAGGVVLDVEGGAAASEAFLAIVATCARARPEARLDGVLVAEMVPAGVELLVGVKNDPAFGPIVVVGLGGVLAELLRDTVTALAPLGEPEALALVSRLRGAAILDGFRGSEPVDRAELARTISRISHLAFDLRGRLRELDVNPLICRGSAITAVDGLAVLSPDAPARRP